MAKEKATTEKILWLDVETGGLDPQIHGITQLGVIIDIDSEIKHVVSYRIKTEMELDLKALELTGLTKAKIARFAPEAEVFNALKSLLETFVDPFDPTDKFTLGGWNVSFDLAFLIAFFKRNNSPFLFSYIGHDLLDPSLIVRTAQDHFGKKVIPTWKLGETCRTFGIDIAAHDAMSDITATRDLHYRLRSIFQGGK